MKKLSLLLFSFCFVWLSFSAVLYEVARHYSPAGEDVEVKLVFFKTFIPTVMVVLLGLYSRGKK